MSQQRRQQQNRGDQNRRPMVQAKESFVLASGDMVSKGDLADARADVVRAHPDKFGEPRVRFTAPRTETATADR